MGPLYFGCWGEMGHYLWTPRHTRPADAEIPAFAGDGGRRLDGTLCPLGREIEGLCALAHLEGWTVISFWDRSGDKRGKSNSNFLLPGTLGQQEALAAARAAFPALFARFPFQVTFGTPGAAPARGTR